MFGFGPKATSQNNQNEAAIEDAKAFVRTLVHSMDGVSPQEAENINTRLKEYCGSSKYLPFPFKQKALMRARELECEANMRTADHLMQLASRFAAAEQMKDKGEKLGEARRYFGKACVLGADMEWRKAFQRLTETIMMTGGVHLKGPSRAKPLDTAPKPPNRAKPEDTAPKVPNRAKA